MLSRPEAACLVIADISGYTDFLAGAELDHAQDILGDLMTSVIGSFRGRFKLAKLEGDAAFAYVLADRLDVSTLLDAVETTYFSFRRRLRDVRQATSCTCNACRLIPSLDLKLVMHHGVVVRQRLAGREELVGSDVIVIHRLLKNHVADSLGIPAYALFTSACLDAAGADPAPLGLREHRELVDGVGETTVWVLDLGAAWEAELRRTRVVLDPRSSIAFRRSVPLAPAEAWDYLTAPGLRPTWQAGVHQVIEEVAGSTRRGVGTTNHCVHGATAVVEEILDWRPYDYVTLRSKLPVPDAPKLRSMIELVPSGGATQVTFYLEPPRGARAKAIAQPLLDGYIAALTASFDNLEARLAMADSQEDAPR
jgi:hypothetical protein